MTKIALISAALAILGKAAFAEDCPAVDGFYPVALAAPDATTASTEIELCKGDVAKLVISEGIDTLVIGDPQVVAANLGSDSLVFLTGLNSGESDVVVLSDNGAKLATVSLKVIGATSRAPAPVPPPVDGSDRQIVIMKGTDMGLLECAYDCLRD